MKVESTIQAFNNRELFPDSTLPRPSLDTFWTIADAQTENFLFPLEGEGTFTFSYTVTTADWNAYGPNSRQNPWTGIPFINSDNSLTFSMSTTPNGTDTEVTITVTSIGTRSPLTGLNFYGTGTSQTTNETVQGNLAAFTKIVINDFGGVFLSRNRGSQVFGQFENLPTLSFAVNAGTRSGSPLILTGTSLRDCFLFCNNFNENLNNWDFSEVVNMRSMLFGLSNSDVSDYQFTKGSASPELDYLSINTESIAPSTSYTIKVRQITDEDGLIIFTGLDYYNSDSRLDLLKDNGEAVLIFDDVSFEFDITNVTFSGTVAPIGAITSDAEWTFTVVSKSTSGAIPPFPIPNESEVEFSWECTPFNKFNNGGVQPNWDTQKVTNMRSVFYTQNDLDFTFNFDTSLATNVDIMFKNCTSFNNGGQELTLNLPEAVELSEMFYQCTAFNQTITLTVPKATNMSFMFSSCTAFNQTVTLTAPKAENLLGIFSRCTSFNNGGQPLTLNLPEAVNLSGMFENTTVFNQTVTLTAPKAENLRFLFNKCTNFNNGGQELILDLPEATDLGVMFQQATAFNQKVVLTAPKATDFRFMFWRSTAFNNNGENFTNKDGEFWKISGVTSMTGMFFDVVGLTDDNYSNFLIGCANQAPNIQSSVQLDANLATPNTEGVAAKTTLESAPYFWTIIDATS
jgi:hypothetical protein